MTTPPPAERGPSADPVDWDAEEEAAETARPPGAHRRRWWAVGTVAVVLMTALAVVWGLSATVGRVYWMTTGYEVVSEERLDVRLDLRRDEERAVTCRVEAQGDGYVVVGRAEVELGPTPDSPSRHVVSVRTAAPPVNGYVDTCWYSDEEPRS